MSQKLCPQFLKNKMKKSGKYCSGKSNQAHFMPFVKLGNFLSCQFEECPLKLSHNQKHAQTSHPKKFHTMCLKSQQMKNEMEPSQYLTEVSSCAKLIKLRMNCWNWTRGLLSPCHQAGQSWTHKLYCHETCSEQTKAFLRTFRTALEFKSKCYAFVGQKQTFMFMFNDVMRSRCSIFGPKCYMRKQPSVVFKAKKN